MAQIITSVHNKRVKSAARLRASRGRRLQGRIIIDGLREVSRAMDAGVAVEELFVCESMLRSADARGVVQQVARGGAEVLPVAEAVFAKLAFGERTEGVVAVAQTPRRSLADLATCGGPLVAVLEHVEKPGNIGAVVRSADAAGVAAVIVVGEGADLYNPNAIRASLGTIFVVPVVSATSEATLSWLRQGQFRIFTARVGAPTCYCDITYEGPCAIILGSESRGLSDAWSGEGITPVSLPMKGVADSLNVSATAAVIFFEALRQRQGR